MVPASFSLSVRASVVLGLAVVCVWSAFAADPAVTPVAPSASLISYAAPNGETYFALSLKGGEFPPEVMARAAGPHDHVVIVDTSASQAGAHRKQTLAVLDACLKALPARDRVSLYAVDTQVKALTSGFFNPGSPELQAAVKALKKRIPLGATNLYPALDQARRAFDGTRPGSIVYLGDGMSVGKLIDPVQFQKLLADLRRQQVPVNSFAVGPRTDLQVLGILAEHTGGVVLIDSLMNDARQPAEQVGQSLAKASNAAVYYPSKIELNPAPLQLLPVAVPPIRGDRDTVLLGRGALAGPVTITTHSGTGKSGTGDNPLVWKAKDVKSQAGNTFLAGLWAASEADQGLRVAVAGSELLNMARQGHEDHVLKMVLAGRNAVATRDIKQAEQIAWAIRQMDPANTEARTILKASESVRQKMLGKQLAFLGDDKPGADAKPADAKPAAETPADEKGADEKPAADKPPVDAPPAKKAAPPKAAAVKDAPSDDATDEKPAEEKPAAAKAAAPAETEKLDNSDDAAATGTTQTVNLLEQERERRRLRGEMMTREINRKLNAAQRVASDDPDAAMFELKQAQNTVMASTDIDADIRTQLLARIRAVTNQAVNSREVTESTRIRLAERRAQEESTRKLVDQLVQKDQKLEQLIDRVRSLLVEGYLGDENAFEEAEAVSRAAWELDPYSGTTSAAIFDSEAAGQLDKAQRLRYTRADKLLETLYQVELSHIPFPDEPPIIYPPAEVWKALTQRRLKWKSVDLLRDNPVEEKIRKSLDSITEVAFIETPLKDALSFLKEQHDINMWLNEAKITDEGVATDTPITLSLAGITLRSALKLLLEPLQLTYIIEDEVMKITTVVDAGERLTTRVYPVADLVIPIRQLRGAGGGLQGAASGGGGGMMGGGGMGGGAGF